MKIIRGYKTELALNNKQTTECLRHAGAARYVYNWGLNLPVEMTPGIIPAHRPCSM
jgi:hypothetical protein